MSISMQAMSSSQPSLSVMQDTHPGNPASRKLLAPATNSTQRQLLQTPSENVPDTRTVVPDTSVYPFNTIGLIQIYGEDGSLSGFCSGALIKARVILTAGHCIWEPETNAFIGSADFTPGYNPVADNPAPYGTVNVVKMMVPTLFTECSDRGDANYGPCHQAVDFGLMLIEEEYTEWMGYGYDGTDTGNEMVNTAGYPGEPRLYFLQDSRVPIATNTHFIRKASTWQRQTCMAG